MLLHAAANEWKVPIAGCSAANGVITHKASNRSTTYGKVAEAAAKLEPPKEVTLKDPKDWKIAGKGIKRLDTVEKTTGQMVYGIDVKLPGMLNAAIKDCPVFGGKQNGDAKAGLAKAAKKITAEYAYPYQNHACMEPMNATALYTADKCEVWCGTQNGEAAFAAVLDASGLPAEKCDVHKTILG